jgi:hypothetical protein
MFEERRALFQSQIGRFISVPFMKATLKIVGKGNMLYIYHMLQQQDPTSIDELFAYCAKDL